MHKRLMSFITKYEILCPEQHCFQKGKSTSLAAFKLIDNIIQCVNKKTPITTIFFEMSRAFDCVSHKIILRKCEAYGIRGPALLWITSYLHNRMQRVDISNVNANNEEVVVQSQANFNHVGVPHGSILGPLLFLLYVNDLPSITKYQCILYADDVSVVVPYQKNLVYVEELDGTIRDIVS